MMKFRGKEVSFSWIVDQIKKKNLLISELKDVEVDKRKKPKKKKKEPKPDLRRAPFDFFKNQDPEDLKGHILWAKIIHNGNDVRLSLNKPIYFGSTQVPMECIHLPLDEIKKKIREAEKSLQV